ncbi:GNAT family N-acetyltransferase [Saliterribacillus persicus]|uniref:N-acetylglutamate synthase-like GNAT family acetyltransferase n=1 Tax=Saliterribacillus persicus TaxID=930114 RepID=A0A368X9B0_9BACI|nr:GNAT family N-acetyltransferase [Saliterribacillus persicus]RCW64541.1 N-acetylglutamate synthase-like GNAT family acetyltransferase [Saliterribacillus persicus]
MDIREATINDVPDLVSLMEQLGYPTSIDKFKMRFNTITANPSYHTLVTEMDGKIVGMAGLCTGLFYEYDGSYVQIVAFVVNTNYRRKGIGEKLIQEVESWAKKQGAIAIALNSGNRKEREVAHHFYTSMGYTAKSTGFGKSLI